MPSAVWINTLKADPGETASRIAGLCPQARPLSWPEGAYQIPAQHNPGKWPEFQLGLLHSQEEVTLYPVYVLDPQPGESVLDMCAAPGNKTALIGLQMRDRGHILANDVSWNRIRALRDVLNRLGISCAAVSRCNGSRLQGWELFDRVLVDAPCTGEGTSRKTEGWNRYRGERDWNKLCGLQRGLLRRALNLTRPGGVVVYCTCTYAPEENEWVLSGIYPEVARIEEVELPPSIRAEPGITHWKGMHFREDVARAARLWPHLNNTGGFFLAKLRKL